MIHTGDEPKNKFELIMSMIRVEREAENKKRGGRVVVSKWTIIVEEELRMRGR